MCMYGMYVYVCHYLYPSSQTLCRSVSLLTNKTTTKKSRKQRQLAKVARVFKLARRMRVLAKRLYLSLSPTLFSISRSQTVRCRAKSATDRSKSTFRCAAVDSRLRRRSWNRKRSRIRSRSRSWSRSCRRKCVKSKSCASMNAKQ